MAYQPTTNFGWAMPRGGDQAQISVINQQFTAKADEIVYQTRRMIAPGYIDDGTKTYHEGDIVEYENVDYVCTGTTSGAWDSSKWDATDMATQIQEAKESGGGASALADLDDVEITSPTEGQILTYDDDNDEWVNTDMPTLGTASSKDVAASGNASSTQVVMGNDTRLTDRRGSTWGQINGTLANQTDLNTRLTGIDTRVDNLLNIPQGSTTADAALYDIKTGFDGVVYDSPGAAVRACDQILDGKIDDLKSALDEKTNCIYNSIKQYIDNDHPYASDSVWNSDGTIASNPATVGYKAQSAIKLIPGSYYVLDKIRTIQTYIDKIDGTTISFNDYTGNSTSEFSGVLTIMEEILLRVTTPNNKQYSRIIDGTTAIYGAPTSQGIFIVKLTDETYGKRNQITGLQNVIEYSAEQLFDKTNLQSTAGYYNENGNWQSDSNYFTSKLIEVNPNTAYHISHINGLLLISEWRNEVFVKETIISSASSSFIPTENCIKVSALNSNLDNVILYQTGSKPDRTYKRHIDENLFVNNYTLGETDNIVKKISDFSIFDHAFVQNQKLVVYKGKSNARYTGIDLGADNLCKKMTAKILWEKGAIDSSIPYTATAYQYLSSDDLYQQNAIWKSASETLSNSATAGYVAYKPLQLSAGTYYFIDNVYALATFISFADGTSQTLSDYIGDSNAIVYTGIITFNVAVTIRCSSEKNKFVRLVTEQYYPALKEGLLCMIAEKNGIKTIYNITYGSIHVCFLPSRWHLDVWGRTQGGGTLMTTVYSSDYTTPCVTDGEEEYEFGWEIQNNIITAYKKKMSDETIETWTVNGNSMTAQTDITFADGTSYLQGESFTVDFSALNGQYLIWEHYANGNFTKYNIPEFTEISASKNNDIRPCFFDNFQQFDGALNRTPLGYCYSQFTGTDFIQ